MDSEGAQEARGTHANPVPRPAGPPELPPTPPRPTHAPGRPTPSGIADWLNESRPETRLGIWRLGYRPPKSGDAQRRLSATTIAGMIIPAVIGMIIWSLWLRGAVPYQWAPLRLVTPDDWWETATEINAKPGGWGIEAFIAYRAVSFALLVWVMARLGSWGKAFRYYFARKPQPRRAALTALWALVALALVFPSAFPGAFWAPVPVVDPLLNLTVALSQGYELLTSPLYVYSLYTVVTLLVIWPFARVGDWRAYAQERLAVRRSTGTDGPAQPALVPPAQWPALRDAGQHQAADVLAAEVLAGRMNDVDCARIEYGWVRARRQGRLAAFTDTVRRQGAAAFTHPSGSRDLQGRAAHHDLLTGQVRIGRWATADRTPLAYGGAGAALGPAALGTSLLVVGPSGAGKTRHVIAPVAESLALQALTGSCAVVVVCGAGAPVGADSWYDVVVRIGDPDSVHDLDPYADATDPDEAAGFLAEAFAGDLETVEVERAATALAQLLGPYRAAYGRFPTLPALRELLEGDAAAVSGLRERLAADQHAAMHRELDARLRQAGAPGDPAPALADRLALLDRPAFADFFGSGAGAIRPFSLRAVTHHPLRVRIDLPERGHEQASRLIARLVLAQFAEIVRDNSRDQFISLLLDDATGTITPTSVRRIQRLRSQNAGVVLALRTVSDVPEALHGPLYGAVGCRMALAGVTTWDGGRFADAWGTEWVETRDVAQHTVFADQPMTRAMHALRKLVTGEAVTTEAITVRQVERERWSASELAHSVPPGHAVLSLTSVDGEHAPPLLVDLRG